MPSWDYQMDGDIQVFNWPSGATWAYTEDKLAPSIADEISDIDGDDEDQVASVWSSASGKSMCHHGLVKKHILKTKGKDMVMENPIKFKGKGMGKAKEDPNIDQHKGKGKAQKEPKVDKGKGKGKVMKEPNIAKGKGRDKVMRVPIIEQDKGKGKGKKDPNIDQGKGKGKAKKEPNIDQGKVKGKVMKEPNIAKGKGKGKCKAKAMDHKCTLRHREHSKVYQQTMKQMLKAGITADRAKQAAREAACAHVQSMFGPSGKGAK
jgi:hypothetical protein